MLNNSPNVDNTIRHNEHNRRQSLLPYPKEKEKEKDFKKDLRDITKEREDNLKKEKRAIMLFDFIAECDRKDKDTRRKQLVDQIAKQHLSIDAKALFLAEQRENEFKKIEMDRKNALLLKRQRLTAIAKLVPTKNNYMEIDTNATESQLDVPIENRKKKELFRSEEYWRQADRIHQARLDLDEHHIQLANNRKKMLGIVLPKPKKATGMSFDSAKSTNTFKQTVKQAKTRGTNLPSSSLDIELFLEKYKRPDSPIRRFVPAAVDNKKTEFYQKVLADTIKGLESITKNKMKTNILIEGKINQYGMVSSISNNFRLGYLHGKSMNDPTWIGNVEFEIDKPSFMTTNQELKLYQKPKLKAIPNKPNRNRAYSKSTNDEGAAPNNEEQLKDSEEMDVMLNELNEQDSEQEKKSSQKYDRSNTNSGSAHSRNVPIFDNPVAEKIQPYLSISRTARYHNKKKITLKIERLPHHSENHRAARGQQDDLFPDDENERDSDDLDSDSSFGASQNSLLSSAASLKERKMSDRKSRIKNPSSTTLKRFEPNKRIAEEEGNAFESNSKAQNDRNVKKHHDSDSHGGKELNKWSQAPGGTNEPNPFTGQTKLSKPSNMNQEPLSEWLSKYGAQSAKDAETSNKLNWPPICLEAVAEFGKTVFPTDVKKQALPSAAERTSPIRKVRNRHFEVQKLDLFQKKESESSDIVEKGVSQYDFNTPQRFWSQQNSVAGHDDAQSMYGTSYVPTSTASSKS
ncbi:hypothetical protein HDV02_005120 [Globomyces sp. JEL0801]|nr:hypothetical protein HDV02_005120 [Globomyces sp. JEL0801]